MRSIFFKFLFLVSIFPASTNAQVLTNTTWKVFDSSSSFFLFFNFDGDTLSFSSDSISYSNVSLYTEIGANFNVTDLIGSCSTYTGQYSFAISTDTLMFTLIEDTCDTSRPPVFTDFYWISQPLGVRDLKEFRDYKIFPNPASNYFTLETDINSIVEIADLSGKIISRFRTINKNSVIDLQNFDVGIYTVIVNKYFTKKLVVVR